MFLDRKVENLQLITKKRVQTCFWHTFQRDFQEEKDFLMKVKAPICQIKKKIQKKKNNNKKPQKPCKSIAKLLWNKELHVGLDTLTMKHWAEWNQLDKPGTG